MLAGWLPLLRIINIANQQIILLYLAAKVAQSKMDSITEQEFHEFAGKDKSDELGWGVERGYMLGTLWLEQNGPSLPNLCFVA